MPVGGLTVYEHFEINVSPSKVCLAENSYSLLWYYFYPEIENVAKGIEIESGVDDVQEVKLVGSRVADSKNEAEVDAKKGSNDDTKRNSTRVRWLGGHNVSHFLY